MISNKLKQITFPVIIILSVSCSQVKNTQYLPNIDNPLKVVISNQQSTKHIDKNNRILIQFITAYRELQIGNIDKSILIFEKMSKSKNKNIKEYGLFGLLLIDYETGNVINLHSHLQILKNLDNKSPWLKKGIICYQVIYDFTMAKFEEAKKNLATIPKSDIDNNPLLLSIQANLLIRDNKLKQARKLLQNIDTKNVELISTKAKLLSLSVGYKEALDYLEEKIQTDPNNEYLKLIFIDYLFLINEKKAINKAYQLGLSTKNSYILLNETNLIVNRANKNNIDKINKLYKKIQQESQVKKYIDYYLLEIILFHNQSELNKNVEIANTFNPMNNYLLWYQYYFTNQDKQLDYLHKIEHIDPYDNYVLLELAKYYHAKSMNNKLLEIKNRFKKSNRVKSREDIDLMKTF